MCFLWSLITKPFVAWQPLVELKSRVLACWIVLEFAGEINKMFNIKWSHIRKHFHNMLDYNDILQLFCRKFHVDQVGYKIQTSHLDSILLEKKNIQFLFYFSGT